MNSYQLNFPSICPSSGLDQFYPNQNKKNIDGPIKLIRKSC